MVYPISILCVALIVVIVLLTKVIPIFENMFIEMKAGSLPAPTQVVINISNGFIGNWYWFFGGALAVSTTFTASLRTKKGRQVWDAL